MLRTAALALASLSLAAAATNAGVVTIFSTGFETSEGYAPGQLGGQSDWSVRTGTSPSPVNPNFARVVAGGALAGSQSLLLDGTQLITNYSNIWGETFRGTFVGRTFSIPTTVGAESFAALEINYTATWTPGAYGNSSAPTGAAQAYSGPNFLATGGFQSYHGVNYCGGINSSVMGASITFAAPSTHQIKLRVDYTTNTITVFQNGVLAATLPQTGVTTMPDNFAFAMYNDAIQAAFPSTMLVDNVQINAVYVPTCPPDFNASGATDVQDIFDFLAAWFVGDLRADFNASATTEIQDIFDFLAAWFAGC